MKRGTLSRETLLEMDPELLRAVIRELSHHRVDQSLRAAIAGEGGLPPSFGVVLQQVLDVWEERGLPEDADDIRWARELLRIGQRVGEGEHVDFGTGPICAFPPDALAAVTEAIRTRRSIRRWTEEEVSDELIDRVIEAGLWAPHSCNLQTVRVIVMKGDGIDRLFRRPYVMTLRVMLVVCQDMRPYEIFGKLIPEYNQGFDCGAAVQNMLLMAHALGLGAVWLTYGARHKSQVRKLYNLPDHIHVATFVALGWPAENPLPPGRLRAHEAIIG